MTKKIVSTAKAPSALGPYNQAVIANGFVFCSGQVAINPATGELVAGGIEEQTERVLKNLRVVLEAAGSGLGKVVKTTVFLKNMDDFKAMNGIYATFFKENPPARAAVEVARLPLDVQVEIECVALV
ncbi:MAG TPA: RidA family protein [Acidobacteriota bacterium]|nr:RidA family protein [Acidobacteriota bacterium]